MDWGIKWEIWVMILDFLNNVKKKKKKDVIKKIKPEEILINSGLYFQTKNNGLHIIVYINYKPKADFWPTTGKWKLRKGKDGFGVYNLIRKLKS